MKSNFLVLILIILVGFLIILSENQLIAIGCLIMVFGLFCSFSDFKVDQQNKQKEIDSIKKEISILRTEINRLLLLEKGYK